MSERMGTIPILKEDLDSLSEAGVSVDDIADLIHMAVTHAEAQILQLDSPGVASLLTENATRTDDEKVREARRVLIYKNLREGFYALLYKRFRDVSVDKFS